MLKFKIGNKVRAEITIYSTQDFSPITRNFEALILEEDKSFGDTVGNLKFWKLYFVDGRVASVSEKHLILLIDLF